MNELNPTQSKQYTPFVKGPDGTVVVLKTSTKIGIASKVMVSLGILGATGGFVAAVAPSGSLLERIFGLN